MINTKPADQLSAVLIEEDPSDGLCLVDSGWAEEHT